MKTAKRFTFSIILGLLLCTHPPVQAQVTIGTDLLPNYGTLIDLKQNNNAANNSTKGLGMPRVKLTNLKPIDAAALALSMGAAGSYDPDMHIGLVVYNTNKVETQASRICPGLHVWDGTTWLPLQPYPTVTETRKLKTYKLNSFTPLTLPTDPMWTTLGKDPAAYPLGYVGTIDDIRGADIQTYHTARFYVGYANVTNTYTVSANYSCNATTPVLISSDISEPAKDIFEDGVWMTENLRATTMPAGSAGTMLLDGGNSGDLIRYAYSNGVEANKSTYGVLYSWRAAANTGTGAGQSLDRGDVFEAGLDEGVRRQGICPAGWHLPSDRQWSDLGEGIARKATLFTTTEVDGMSLANLGTAMKATGTSKLANEGGFAALLAGNAGGWWGYYGFNSISYFWTSSTAQAIQNRAYYRAISTPALQQLQDIRNFLMSVRCKKDS